MASERAKEVLGSYIGFPQATASTRRFARSTHDLLCFDELLTNCERLLRDRVRSFAEGDLAAEIVRHWESATFPFQFLDQLGKLGICGLTIKGYGCPGLSPVAAGLVLYELSRVDASISTFVLVHGSLAALTIAEMGSEEQKQRYLPRLATCELTGCWALTEPGHGSDAAAMETTARKVDGGWVLNGFKRWIGNGTFADVTVVWARDTASKRVKAFVVEKGSKGHRATKIENKTALRCVQNADIVLEDCFVPDSCELPGARSFADTAKVLQTSRVLVAWMVLGVAAGVYDAVHRYVSEREQFGVPLAAFAVNQEKLMRMLGAVEACTGLVLRLTRLREEGRATAGMSALVKAWVSRQCREAVALGRELMGGNGVVADFHVGKAFCDLEALYTYEGTYDINMLVAGREATGAAAIRPPGQGPSHSRL